MYSQVHCTLYNQVYISDAIFSSDKRTSHTVAPNCYGITNATHTNTQLIQKQTIQNKFQEKSANPQYCLRLEKYEDAP